MANVGIVIGFAGNACADAGVVTTREQVAVTFGHVAHALGLTDPRERREPVCRFEEAVLTHDPGGLAVGAKCQLTQ